jgi:apolipoprotein N-acyltransferase
VAGVAFGLAFFGSLLYWIRLFGNLAYVSLTIVQTLWIVAALLLGRMLRGRLLPGLRFAALPLAFLAGEFARTHLPWGGFAWGGLGYTQHDNPLALRLAPYTGVWGLSLVVLLVNSLIAEAVLFRREARRRVTKRLVAAAVLTLFPAVLPVGEPAGESARLALVQGNVPGDTVDPNADDQAVLDNHVELTRGLDTSDLSLVVWPEGAFDRDPFRDPEFKDALERTVRRAETPFLVGAIQGTAREGLRNSVVLFDENADTVSEYTKQRLVPFGEFVPWRSFLQPMVRELDRVPHDLLPGDTRTVFTLPEGKFAAAICYESTYPDLVRAFVQRGARLLVVSTNFSSYDRTAAADQHIAFSQLRAAEHRIWVAHAALSGKSAVVAPDGAVVETTDLFTQAVLTPTIRFAEKTTLYGRLGDWVPFAAIGLTVMLIVVRPLSRRLSEEKRLVAAHPDELEPEPPPSDEIEKTGAIPEQSRPSLRLVENDETE